MKNMTMQVNGNKLVIEVDLAQDLGPSKSGKTVLIASSEGNVACPGREQALARNLGEEALDEIEPGGTGRGEVEMKPRVLGEPRLHRGRRHR